MPPFSSPEEVVYQTFRKRALNLKPPFRGSFVENAATAAMGKGHNNDGQPFDINTACYLKPIVQAYHQASTEFIALLGGVKTLKSFMVELAAAYQVAHGRGDVIIYFGSGEVADETATTRILDFNKQIPSYAEKLATASGQYDQTMSAVKFPDKTFFIKPANLANVQQKNVEFLGMQDAFVTGDTGMIDQSLARTTQYQGTRKIFLESQGGEKPVEGVTGGFDFDRFYHQQTDQRELHVNCPCCGRSHIWNWRVWDVEEMTRPNEFQATLPRETVREILKRHGCEDRLEEVMQLNHE